MKINWENVVEIEITLDEARDFTDATFQRFDEAVDEAQGKVYTGEAEEAYVLVRIKK